MSKKFGRNLDAKFGASRVRKDSFFLALQDIEAKRELALLRIENDDNIIVSSSDEESEASPRASSKRQSENKPPHSDSPSTDNLFTSDLEDENGRRSSTDTGNPLDISFVDSEPTGKVSITKDLSKLKQKSNMPKKLSKYKRGGKSPSARTGKKSPRKSPSMRSRGRKTPKKSSKKSPRFHPFKSLTMSRTKSPKRANKQYKTINFDLSKKDGKAKGKLSAKSPTHRRRSTPLELEKKTARVGLSPSRPYRKSPRPASPGNSEGTREKMKGIFRKVQLQIKTIEPMKPTKKKLPRSRFDIGGIYRRVTQQIRSIPKINILKKARTSPRVASGRKTYRTRQTSSSRAQRPKTASAKDTTVGLAVVTGADTPCGIEITKSLTAKGVTVVAVGPTAEGLEAALIKLRPRSASAAVEQKKKSSLGDLIPCCADICTQQGCELVVTLVRGLVSTLEKPFCYLVHSMGCQLPTDKKYITLSNVEEKRWTRLQNEMITAPLLLTNALLPLFDSKTCEFNRVLFFVREKVRSQRTLKEHGIYSIGEAALRCTATLFRSTEDHESRVYFGTVNPVEIFHKTQRRKSASEKPGYSSPRAAPIKSFVLAEFIAWILVEANLSHFKREFDIYNKIHHRHWAVAFKRNNFL